MAIFQILVPERTITVEATSETHARTLALKVSLFANGISAHRWEVWEKPPSPPVCEFCGGDHT